MPPMISKFLFLFMLLCTLSARAQWIEHFDSADWSNQFNWKGDLNAFAIEDDKLRSNSDSINAEFYLVREIDYYPEMVWEFWVNLKFNTSSVNYLDVYLFSDSSNLKGPKNGYFVRIGNTKDEIALYKSKVGIAPIMLIDGRDNVSNGSNNIIKIKVERSAIGQWVLSSSLGAGGVAFKEGTVLDNEFTQANYFGLMVKQSTASFHKKHFLDNVYVGEPIKDKQAPIIQVINVVTDNTLEIVFDEPIQLNNIIDSCVKIVGEVNTIISSTNTDTLLIVFNKKFSGFKSYQLMLTNISDSNANFMKDTSVMFVYVDPDFPEFKQLLITELMVDPEPSVNLPAIEYIELLNRHNYPIQLKGSTLSDPTKTVVLPDFIIYPGEFIVLCELSQVNNFSTVNRVLGVVGLLSLNNTSDEITLKNSNDILIHKVAYNDKWYRDEIKKLGGWSLEMIDTSGLCFEEANWIASMHQNGGTPGKVNSVNSVNRDTIAPSIIGISVNQLGYIDIEFSEQLDSLEAVNKLNYITHGFAISSISCISSSIHIVTTSNFEIGSKYNITFKSARDCSGNRKGDVIYPFVIPDSVVGGDVVINEILFNPRASGVDYIELYNTSNKYLNLKDLFLCNRDSSLTFKNIKAITKIDRIIAPNGFALITTSKTAVISEYPNGNAAVYIEVESLPTLNNDKGDVYLINAVGITIDGVSYDEEMHHGLLKEVDGVSLEKINSAQKNFSRSNWTSASSSANYGTPGIINSQSLSNLNATKGMQISNNVVSPDYDGYQDVLLISFEAHHPNANLNLWILDIVGRKVKEIAQNVHLGAHDVFQWDGTNDTGNKAPLGVYLIYAEVWGVEIDTIRYKKPVTLGGMLNSK